ncbi:MAG TPA: Sir2 family NAD-dependent protein deacetylase [Myxococcota bacterium]|nr:Sir2 family NAD-dependent protein deacetylase [Myxococcota bacterium]HRY92759.1 Sir2 family NAD-dependent protein deacetylase [Myxococcota bacterium]HSA21467.1 Sir2 family NAD-dependent protein deacetylase [Myxococcota bacterium]
MSKLGEQAEECARLLRQSRSAALLSGAGMSTAAGIQDFRGPQGLYRQLGVDEPERLFDIRHFLLDPSDFYEFHARFVELVGRVQPTRAHRFFAELESRGKLRGIITQNIDSLHQRAGSKNVLEIHGGIWQSTCLRCGKLYDLDRATRLMELQGVPHCESCGGPLKPDVVFFGEAVKHLEECRRLAEQVDLFFVAGSSLVVTPAAVLPALCPGRIVVVNRGELSHAFLPPERIALLVEEDIDTFFDAVRAALGW